MGSQTTNGYPYPVGTDRVMDGDDAIKALAQAADTKAGVMAAGSAVVTIANGASFGTLAVTFPAGRFSAVPVVVSDINTSTNTFMSTCNAPTATGVTLTAATKTGSNVGTATNLTVAWIARNIG